MKTLRNVLLNTRNNKLVPAIIHFEDKIASIEYLTENEFDWSEINTSEKRDIKLHQFKQEQSDVSSEVIDGNFNLLMYGSLDSHVHFDTPGFESKEDIEHASYSATAGGVTCVVDMPCTSIPPITTVKNLLFKKDALKNRSKIDYAFWGGINNGNADKNNTLRKNIEYLIAEGVPGFKVYTISGMSTFKDLSYSEIAHIADIIKKTNTRLAVHAEDKLTIKTKMAEFQFKNQTDWKAYCESRSIEAEVKAVEKLIEISKKSGAHIHVVHLSSKNGLDLIRAAKKEGIRITTETCPHYLYFTQKDFENKSISNFLKTAPPVKFEEDKVALWQGLADGSVDYVTTDHAGCDPMLEKMTSNFWNVYGGIPGVQHRVPFILSEGFVKGKLSLERAFEVLNPYSYFPIEHKGKISTGFDSDFALIDLWNTQKLTYSTLLCKGKYTPFEGVEVSAIVEKTFLRGNIIFDRNNKKNEIKEKNGKFQKVLQ